MRLTYSTLPKISDGSTAGFKRLVVFLHGLGDRGSSWIDFFERYQASHLDTLFVFPDAPIEPVTLNGGLRMPSWFDIIHLDPIEPIEDRKGFEASSKAVSVLIDELRCKYQPENLVLGGFSQGGALSLYATLKGYCKPAALVVLSSYLPFAKTDFNPSLNPTPRKDIPVFMGHGTLDPLINVQWARHSSNVLSSIFKSVLFKEYKGVAHSVSLHEMSDVYSFLDSV